MKTVADENSATVAAEQWYLPEHKTTFSLQASKESVEDCKTNV